MPGIIDFTCTLRFRSVSGDDQAGLQHFGFPGAFLLFQTQGVPGGNHVFLIEVGAFGEPPGPYTQTQLVNVPIPEAWEDPVEVSFDYHLHVEGGVAAVSFGPVSDSGADWPWLPPITPTALFDTDRWADAGDWWGKLDNMILNGKPVKCSEHGLVDIHSHGQDWARGEANRILFYGNNYQAGPWHFCPWSWAFTETYRRRHVALLTGGGTRSHGLQSGGRL